MLKGFFALITTGLLLNPAVFFGGLTGILVYIALAEEQLYELCLSYHLYLLFLILSFLFVLFFRKTLKDDLINLDWKAMSLDTVKYFFLLTFSFFVGILLASYFDFSIPEKKSDTTYSEYSQIIELKKQVEDMQNNYNEMLTKIK